MWFGLSGLSYDVAHFWAWIILNKIPIVNWTLSISKGNGEDPDPSLPLSVSRRRSSALGNLVIWSFMWDAHVFYLYLIKTKYKERSLFRKLKMFSNGLNSLIKNHTKTELKDHRWRYEFNNLALQKVLLPTYLPGRVTWVIKKFLYLFYYSNLQNTQQLKKKKKHRQQ